MLGTEDRPKLELAERTLPLELPPMEDQKKATFDARFQAEREERRLREQDRREKEQQALARKQKALEHAFGSDDEDSYKKDNRRGVAGDDDSDWDDDPKPLYQESSGEEGSE